MEVEFIACFEAFSHGIWLQNFVTKLSILGGIERPLKIYCENKSTVMYSNNNRRVLEVKFLVVKERVQNGQVFIEHIGTNSMIEDPLTKGLTPKVFHEHTARMSVILLDDMSV